MPEHTNFVQKLLRRFDRLDRSTIRHYVSDILETQFLYQKLCDELKEGVIVTTAEGHLQVLNRSAALYLGLTSDIPPRARLQELVRDPSLATFFLNHLKKSPINAVEDFTLLEPRQIHLRVRMLSLPGFPQRDPRILVLLENRSEAREAELDRARLLRTEAIVQLAAGLAHEIGNPLNSLAIHLGLLKKEVKDLPPAHAERIRKSVDILNSETNRLDRFVRNFLKATRKPPLRYRLENLNQVVEAAIEVMRPECEAGGVALQFVSDPDLPSFLLDRERLHQAFLNLIKNAAEAMPKGGLLKISLTHRDNIAVISFQDQGPGISDKDLPHIFEPYFTTKAQGTGLGLMMVYDAVLEHGGRIEVNSRVGKGTTFTLLLPIRRTKFQLPHEKEPKETIQLNPLH